MKITLCGVPQGSFQRILLFLIYANDISQAVKFVFKYCQRMTVDNKLGIHFGKDKNINISITQNQEDKKV